MLVGAVNQEKVIVGAFSVIVKTDGSFAALVLDNADSHPAMITSPSSSRHTRNYNQGLISDVLAGKLYSSVHFNIGPWLITDYGPPNVYGEKKVNISIFLLPVVREPVKK